MNTISRLAAIALASAVAITAAACKPEPEPGTVDLVGDSITLQGGLAGSGLEAEPDDLEVHLGLGWEASDVLDWVHDQVRDGRPQTLAIALGTNDASPSRGGWTWDDITTWIELLDAPHLDACVVVILPALGQSAPAAHRAEVDRARADILTLVASREGPTVVEDWGIVIDADPSVLADDGIHLAGDPDGPYGISAYAAEARMAQIWQGVDQC